MSFLDKIVKTGKKILKIKGENSTETVVFPGFFVYFAFTENVKKR